MISVSCPNCQQSFEVDDALIGRHGRCDHCQTKFLLSPSSPEPVPQVPTISPTLRQPKKSGTGKILGLSAVLALAAGGYYFYQINQQPEPNDTPLPATAVDEDDKKAPVKSATAKQAAPTKSAPKPAVPQQDIAKRDTPKPVTVKKAPTPKPPKQSHQPKSATTKSSPDVPPLGKTFPIKTQFGTIDIRSYLRTYPNVYHGWMPSKKEQAEDAKKWGNHLGPLGVRIRSHVPQQQGRPAFAAIVPHCLRSETGQLALTAAEVVSIAPGSPAENHLQVGDFIVGIEGEDLKSGNQYRPDWDTMHKDARELQLMLGEKIDQAQARGDIRLTVMRYPEQSRDVFSKQIKVGDKRVSTDKIPVTAGDEIQLIVDPMGHNESDHFAWLSPKLYGKNNRTLDLTDQRKIQPIHSETGWGEVSKDKDIQGKSLREKGFGVHAYSKITFTVPEGYSFFRTGMKATKSGGSLKAVIKLNTKQQALPVRDREIWAGKGGNKSVGAQSFDVQVPGDGIISLVSDQFDKSIGGDGACWFDVTVEGDYGTQQLLSLPNKSARAGYGRAKFTTDKPTTHKGTNYSQSLNLHAHGVASWELPKGTKRIKGTFAALSHGKVQPRILYTNYARPLTGIHKEKLVKLRFPIGKTGSFSSTYPKNCPKSELTVTRHTDWLAAQQRADGTWPRLAGYTGNGWDTAWCALALMSSGDAKFDDQVKRAAYYIAYTGGPSEWTAERAMRLIFLAEYYLKTKDRAILAGIQSAYVQLVACAKTDFMAGHKVNGFGYGIAGQHYGTGHLALAMALAARTPIAIDQQLVDGIIRHAGEVCVNGTYAYGRGRRMARDDSRRHGGGNAMVGPGMLGAIIGGGHKTSIQEALERWSASAGDGDNSHATSSLAFIFSSLAMACGDEEVFLKHMQHFRYKMTIDDNWEGGILKSAFALDLQGGEGVTSTWIRSAGSILVLNALKQNLTITGKRENFAKDQIPTQAVSEWGGQVHSYYLRNWCLVKELLGKQAPADIERGIVEMEKLPRTTALVPGVKKIVLRRAPALIASISKNRKLSKTDRAYAIELLCGLDFKIYTSAEGKKQKVELRINHPLHQLNWIDTNKKELLSHESFVLKTDLKITGSNLKKSITYSAKSDKGFNHDTGELKASFNTDLKNPRKVKFKGDAKISFKLGNTSVTYTRPLWFNTEVSHSNNINLRRLSLKLKVAPRAYYQSQPLMIAGRAFDCMYPKERMLEVKGPKDGTVNIHEGDSVLVNLASENLICPWVLSMTFPKMTQVKIAKAKTHRATHGTANGNWADLYDFDDNSSCEIKPANGKTIIEFDFGKEITLNGLDARFQHGSFIRIWYNKKDQWIPLVWDRYSPHTSHNPRFSDTQARLWRVELHHGRNAKLSTLRFYHNPNRIAPQPSFIQSQEKGCFPDIQPN